MTLAEGASPVQAPAVYIRWSTEDQGEGTTLDVQREACQAYIRSQGWPLRDDLIFIDDGVSGATLERPALTRLRAQVQLGQVDCVVVYKLDRLSRTVLDMLKLVLEEWEGRCSVKSAREPIDTLTPAGKLFFYQLLSFAEWERSVIRERTFAGKLRRAQEGRSPGLTLPYGFRRTDTGQIELDEPAAAVVRQMFRQYLSGLGCRAIARALNQEGTAAPRGARWSQPSVGDVLRNPAYVGRLVWGRTRTRKDGRREAREPLVIREGFYPAIVPAEQWDAAQRLRAGRPGPGRSQGTGRSLGSQSLLSGLVRCRCGAPYVGRRTGGYRYYVCTAVDKAGRERCAAGNIRQDDLDRLVAAQLQARYQPDGERMQTLLERDLQHHEAERAASRTRAERSLQRLEESRRRLREWLLEGRLSPEEYRSLQAEMEERIAAARASHRLALSPPPSAAPPALAVSTAPAPTPDSWEGLTLRQRKELLRTFVAAACAWRDRQTEELCCEITWRQ